MIKKVLAGIMIAGVAFYVGTCAVVNLTQRGPSIPDSTKAPYVFTFWNTGQQVLASSYKMQGNVYVLNGYWEKVKGGSYRYHKATIPLDPKILGPVGLATRPVEVKKP